MAHHQPTNDREKRANFPVIVLLKCRWCVAIAATASLTLWFRVAVAYCDRFPIGPV